MLAASAESVQAQATRITALPLARVTTSGAACFFLSDGSDNCVATGQAAGANSVLALTLAGPIRDSACTADRLSKLAGVLGHDRLAYQIACAVEVWRDADAMTERLCIPQPRPWWRFW